MVGWKKAAAAAIFVVLVPRGTILRWGGRCYDRLPSAPPAGLAVAV